MDTKFDDSYAAMRNGSTGRKVSVASKEDFRRRISTRPEDAEQADELLAALGYTSELKRSRSTWGVAFMSFVLASVPYGLSTTLYYPLTGGGPATVIWGWVGVCALMGCVAISLGEITSVYPTAGGVYYQTFMLSPKNWRKMMAWITGWCFVLGNIIITLSVNFGTTLFIIGCVNIFQDGEGTGIWTPQPYQTWLVFVAITFVCNTVSALGNKWLPILDTCTIPFTFVGVLAIIVSVLAIAAGGRRDPSFGFGGFEPISGWTPPGWAFCIGLLHAAYATSATGMVVSMCEEVQKPATQVPKAMVGALFMNFCCGFIFLVPLCFVLPDLNVFPADVFAQPLPVILRFSIGNEAGAFILTVPIIILGVLCGTSCTTAASRCTWAFARDGAIPGSKRLGFERVNDKLGMPLNAMMLSMIIQIALALIYLGSTAAFNAFNGAGVIFLTLSYVIPVAISFFRGRSKTLVGAKYNLGIFGAFCNVVSIAWCAFAIPLFCMPSFLPITKELMNYASVVFVAGIAASALSYVFYGRTHYSGPKVAEELISD
ncbi:unnamed protein product [Zymoseptoria tritici ST99CH_3D1]|uniref:Amino acid permease n=2 Tax=Zymoseptoria tritici TaxID=1047171 RepID=F9XQD9_ZYMTI|nr:uncharacterized protein MYCGRDRAFT_101913 [Zymoseptoria tritici IPO323]EGP82673.1 hypothetical protein MYCGRDRAFT_101913 [Zymoseptoria tritici IPO323]SMQ56311.1 unnamed protein product [Zymoseptoria tritici ST99CH_3D7]SMR64643.1 unnamed protein product [Zymoseptoria tritici ST99CH_3D1]